MVAYLPSCLIPNPLSPRSAERPRAYAHKTTWRGERYEPDMPAKDIAAAVEANYARIKANRHPDAILAYVRSGSSLGGESAIRAKWGRLPR
jgi:hypothetical protein